MLHTRLVYYAVGIDTVLGDITAVQNIVKLNISTPYLQGTLHSKVYCITQYCNSTVCYNTLIVMVYNNIVTNYCHMM